jgi:hypothetical protein
MSTPYAVGVTPRPRLLIRGFGVEVANRLEDLFPTRKLFSSIDEVVISEWDAMLTSGYVSARERVLPVLAIPKGELAEKGFVAYAPTYSAIGYRVAFSVSTVATMHYVAKDAPPELTDLIARDLLPAVKGQRVNHGLSVAYSTDGITPFAVSHDGTILAGAVDDKSTVCWCLPPIISDPVPWMRAAYSAWSKLWPETFPPRENWRSEVKWLTSEMVDAMLEYIETDNKLGEAIRQRQAATDASERAVEEATAAADRGSRRLLTDQGEGLVDAVASALNEIGFDVDLMDERRKKGDLLEDLQIRDTDAPDWVALGEVKGHKKGAQLQDLLRMSRCVVRFLKDTGHEPDRQWYIVNGFLNDDPSTRPDPLKSNADEVASFAQAGGLIIDTRALFLLRQHIVRSTAEPRILRQRLREATGTLTVGNWRATLGIANTDKPSE